MKPQHTGATTHDLTTWGTADYETNQNLAATNPAAAPPGAPVPASSNDQHLPDQTTNTHRLAA
jgi:hypothetical protein